MLTTGNEIARGRVSSQQLKENVVEKESQHQVCAFLCLGREFYRIRLDGEGFVLCPIPLTKFQPLWQI